GGATIVEPFWKTVLRRQAITWHQHAQAGLQGQPRCQLPIAVGQGQAESPAVQVEQDAASRRALLADPFRRHAVGVDAGDADLAGNALDPGVREPGLLAQLVDGDALAPQALDAQAQCRVDDRPGDHGCCVCAAGMWLIAFSAMAVIVSDGLTPGFAGMAAPSQTSRLR